MDDIIFEKYILGMTYKVIISEVIKSMVQAYAPYSYFKVGAALETEDKNFFWM